jgi:hypothetical protein
MHYLSAEGIAPRSSLTVQETMPNIRNLDGSWENNSPGLASKALNGNISHTDNIQTPFEH